MDWDNIPTIEFGGKHGWGGGMDSESDFLPLNTLRTLKGLVNDKQGILRFPGTPKVILATSGNWIRYSLMRYMTDTVNRLIVAEYDAGVSPNFRIALYNGDTGAYISNLITHDNADYAHLVMMEQVGDKVFFTNIWPSAHANTGKLGVWDGGVGTIRVVGLVSPVDAPTVTRIDDPVGNLQSRSLNLNDVSWYRACYTYWDNFGNESQPSPLSIPMYMGKVFFTPLDYHKYEFNVEAAVRAKIAAGEVSKISVYRSGGTITRQLLSIEFVPQLDGTGNILWAQSYITNGAYGGAVGAPPLDNVPDSAQLEVEAPTSNYPPPDGINNLILHQDRLFGTVGATLAASRPGYPEYYGFDDNGVDDDGALLASDESEDDVFTALDTTGSILILGRTNSIYSLYGDNLSEMRFDKRSNHGIKSPYGLKRCDNIVLACSSNDGQVYQIGDSSSLKKSGRLETIFKDAFSGEELVRMMYSSERLYIHDSDVFYVYDMRTDSWMAGHTVSRLLYAGPRSRGGQDEVLAAMNLTGSKDVVRLWQSDGVANVDTTAFQIISAVQRFPENDRGRVKAVIVKGDITVPAAMTAAFKIYVDGKTYTKTLVAGTYTDIILKVESLQRDLQGETFYWEFVGNASSCNIRSVMLAIAKVGGIR